MAAARPTTAAEIEIRPGRDAGFVDELQRRLRERITCDQFRDLPPATEAFADPETLCLEVWVRGERCGVFLIVPLGGKHVVHTLLRSPARGSIAIRAGRSAIEWVWAHTDWPDLYSYCLHGRRDVLLFATLCGFSVHREVDCGISVCGVRETTLILAINRP